MSTTSLVLLVIAVLVVAALVAVAVVVLLQRNARLRSARVEQAGQLRTQAAAHDEPIAASRNMVEEAQVRADEAHARADEADRDVHLAEQVLAHDEAQQEDRLRAADDLDPHREAEHSTGTDTAPTNDPGNGVTHDHANDHGNGIDDDSEGRHRA